MPRELSPGTRIGEYEIKRVLGQGGFGITYLAYDESLARNVAIKEYFPRQFAHRESGCTIVPSQDDQDRADFDWGMKHFVEEARSLTRFRHKNIVGAIRFLRENGTAYLVMEYCDGESLESLAKREGPLQGYSLIPIMNQVLDGLDEVHRSRLLHLDIKPSNIFVKQDGTVVLLDFGSVRQAISSHTKSVMVGSPGYAAPEQGSDDVEARARGPWTDIYGLGATLYRLMTGSRPQEALARLIQDRLAPVVVAPELGHNAPLVGAVNASLRLKPQERPQSISEFRELVNRPLPEIKPVMVGEGPIASPHEPDSFPWMSFAGIGILIVLFVAFFTFSRTTPSADESRKVEDVARDDPGATVEIPERKVDIPTEPVLESKKEKARSLPSTDQGSATEATPPLRAGLPKCPESIEQYRQGCLGIFENDAVRYSGEWQQNRPEGKGELFYKKTGERYVGEVVNGVPSGKGKSTFKNGSEYVGEFSGGDWNGRGIFRSADNSTRYVGDFSGNRILIGIKYSGDCRSVLFAGSFNADFSQSTAYDLDKNLYKCR